MKIFQATIIIDAPLDSVFNFLVNLENAMLWQFGVVKSVKLHNAPITNKSQFRQTVWMMGESFERICEIKSYEPYKEIVFATVSSKIFDYEVKYTFEPMSSGTMLHFAGAIELRGWQRFFRKIIELDPKDYIPTELERIKATLEARK